MKKNKLYSTIVEKTIAVFAVMVITFFGNTQQGTFTKKLTIEDGLLSYDNYNILNDKKGNVWICSKFGISRFSARSHKKFTTFEGLSTNDIWGLDEDSKGRIWLSSFSKGIQYIRNDTVYSLKEGNNFDQIFFSGEVKDTIFFNVLTSNANHRYYLTSKGIFARYKRFDKLGMTVKFDIRREGIFILVDSVKTKTETYLFSIGSNKLTPTKFIIQPPFYGQTKDDLRILRYLEDNKWVYVVPKNGILDDADHLGLSDSRINNIFFTKQFIIVKYSDGLKVLDLKNNFIQRKDVEKVIRSQFLLDDFNGFLVKDYNNNYWYVNVNGPAYFINNLSNLAQEIRFFGQKKIFNATLEPCHIKGSNCFLYCSESDIIHLYNTNTLETEVCFKAPTAIKKFEIRNNKLFVFLVRSIYEIPIRLEKDKLVLIKNKIITHALPDKSFAFDFINDTLIFTSTNTIINIKASGFYKINSFEKNKMTARVEQIIYHPSVILYNSGSCIWEYNIKTGINRQLIAPSFVLMKKISSNKVILFSNKFGVYIYDFSIKKLSLAFNGLYAVNDVVPFQENFLICANEGLFLVKIRNDKIIILKSFFTDTFLGITVNSVVIDDDITVLTNLGMIKLTINNAMKSKISRNNFFIGIFDSQGKKVENRTILDNKNNAIRVTLHDGSFFNISPLIFKYKLVGCDKDWKYSKNRSISYRGLQHGDYQLLVEVSESKFGEYKKLKTVFFSVDSPFYRKWWFFSLIMFCIFLVVSIIVVNLKVNRERKINRKLKMQELEFRALKAQLNPHFVFNALNGIQSMAFKEDRIILNDYICSFSDLIRYVLDNSKQHKISVREELIFLRNYLQVEKIRMNNNLNFEINLDDSINPESTFIYGMIIQPIVENCIVHAFISDQTYKLIVIDIDSFGNLIRFEITDNGIGRVKSGKMNRSKTHKSWASTILKEKSLLLNSIKSNELSIETVDLYFSNGESSGTKVIVLMSM